MGECSGKILSTPTPAEIFRTVKEELTLPPRRAITIPSKTWILSFSPSRTFTCTRTVSPTEKTAGFSRSSRASTNFTQSMTHLPLALRKFPARFLRILGRRRSDQVGPFQLRDLRRSPLPPSTDLGVIARE